MTPNLGLATNEDLMRELICRFKMEQFNAGAGTISINGAIERALTLSEMIGGMSAPEREYRTVDEEPRQQVPYTPKRVSYNNPIKKAPKKGTRLGSKKQRDERNLIIYGMHTQGMTFAQIAAKMNLSPEYIRQIVNLKKTENDALVILEKANENPEPIAF